MDSITLIRALEALDLSPQSYSGRGMFGRSCVGVVLDGNQTEFSVGAALAVALGPDVVDLRVSSDSMGLWRILYFPNVRWPGSDEDDAG